MIEVERKWVARVADRAKFDELTKNWEGLLINQFYLVISEKEEIRIRHELTIYPGSIAGKTRYYVTSKFDNGRDRDEAEHDFPSGLLQFLEKLAVGTIIRKARRVRSIGKFEISIDEYRNPATPKDVVVLEVEFRAGYQWQDEEETKKFTLFDLPQEIRDVLTDFNEKTDVPAFKNKNIALNGKFPVI